MINKISFKNYKSFKEQQELELKAITVVIGKNSSGKSAVVKLPTLIEGSLSGDFIDPISIVNDGIELGAEFRDLVYGRNIGSLEISIEENNNSLSVELTSGSKDSDLPKIRRWNFNNELEYFYKDIDNSYFNTKEESLDDIEFNGFNILSERGKNISHLFSLTTNYIGPFREIPKRNYTSKGSIKSNKLGIIGEYTYQILISDFLYKGSKLLKKVSKWYEDNFDGWGIQINSKSKPDYKIELVRTNPDFSINLKDVGEGMSQVLPLVVSAFMENDLETLTILEQPELHLHPAAHGNLAELFALSGVTTNNKFLIETHSQNFVLRLRRMIAEKRLERDDLAIYSVEYDSVNNTSSLKKIDVDELGNVAYWPKNVFSETLDETMAIRNAQLKNI
jgi:predicted ATPase